MYLWVRKHGIDFSTNEQNVHTGVKPEHADNDCSQAPISIRIVAHMVDIVGKQIRKTKPSACGEDSSGKLS